MLPACGPFVTEPMPDIPQTVEYETVRIEYGTEDLLPAAQQPLQQPLVGDQSDIALITRLLVRGTNRAIRDQIALVDAISKFPPSAFTDNSWTWENAEGYQRLELVRSVDDVQQISYELFVGETKAAAEVALSGVFTRFESEVEGAKQEGEGILRFNFDVGDREASGRIAIAFRATKGVRQVRVAFFNFRETADVEPNNALYEYTQLPDATGVFTYAALQDFLKDGTPLEDVAMTTAWTSDQLGRAVARVEGGSLGVEQILINECWDGVGRVVWSDAEPNLPDDDGEFEACEMSLQPLELVPPVVVVPTQDPEIPAPHPAEE
jgi:hypothetical protein